MSCSADDDDDDDNCLSHTSEGKKNSLVVDTVSTERTSVLENFLTHDKCLICTCTWALHQSLLAVLNHASHSNVKVSLRRIRLYH